MMDPATSETIFRNPFGVEQLQEHMEGDGNSVWSLFENSANKFP
jgi:hypothetical protein